MKIKKAVLARFDPGFHTHRSLVAPASIDVAFVTVPIRRLKNRRVAGVTPFFLLSIRRRSVDAVYDVRLRAVKFLITLTIFFGEVDN